MDNIYFTPSVIHQVSTLASQLEQMDLAPPSYELFNRKPNDIPSLKIQVSSITVDALQTIITVLPQLTTQTLPLMISFIEDNKENIAPGATSARFPPGLSRKGKPVGSGRFNRAPKAAFSFHGKKGEAIHGNAGFETIVPEIPSRSFGLWAVTQTLQAHDDRFSM